MPIRPDRLEGGRILIVQRVVERLESCPGPLDPHANRLGETVGRIALGTRLSIGTAPPLSARETAGAARLPDRAARLRPRGGRGPNARAPVKDTFDWLVHRIGEVVEEAQQAGELPATLDVRSTAATIVAVVQGGYVMARATRSSKSFTDATNGLVSLLGGEIHSR